MICTRGIASILFTHVVSTCPAQTGRGHVSVLVGFLDDRPGPALAGTSKLVPLGDLCPRHSRVSKPTFSLASYKPGLHIDYKKSRQRPCGFLAQFTRHIGVMVMGLLLRSTRWQGKKKLSSSMIGGPCTWAQQSGCPKPQISLLVPQVPGKSTMRRLNHLRSGKAWRLAGGEPPETCYYYFQPRALLSIKLR